jgi:hypothetical protein
MVKVSTLFHRVDGFDESGSIMQVTDSMDLVPCDSFLQDLLGPLEVDPGDKLVNAVLERI